MIHAIQPNYLANTLQHHQTALMRDISSQKENIFWQNFLHGRHGPATLCFFVSCLCVRLNTQDEHTTDLFVIQGTVGKAKFSLKKQWEAREKAETASERARNRGNVKICHKKRWEMEKFAHRNAWDSKKPEFGLKKRGTKVKFAFENALADGKAKLSLKKRRKQKESQNLP